MYNLSKKFNKFYEDEVVLSQKSQDELQEKKRLNLERLEKGLNEYNSDNNTSYKIKESLIQGSMAMHTIVQNDEKDYDIDVAVVFNKDDLGDKGPQSTRNMVADALRRKTKQFNAEPEVKTSCVRVKYAEGYHIDFAVYRRSWDEDNECWEYEHAGSNWEKRDLRGLTNWFNDKNEGDKLRKVVRLSKMFCKSRESWKNMPSGLLQTVLCEEKLQSNYDRVDEMFYHTMEKVVERLKSSVQVYAPVDDGRDLTPRKSDREKLEKWRNRLQSKLEDLEVLFKSDCTENDALQAWYGFFNHDFWNIKEEDDSGRALWIPTTNKLVRFMDNEEFIEELFPINYCYKCKVNCTVTSNGFRPQPIREFLRILGLALPHNFRIKCEMVYTDCPKPYDIYWKVKNVGPEAERKNMLRGRIKEGTREITEHSDFFGNHYIECYIIKEGRCVARDRIEIPIGRK